MAAPTDVLIRIDEIEGELRGLSAELHEIRALVTQAPSHPPPSRHPPSRAGDRPPVAGRPGSAARGRDRRCPDPSLRGRAECRPRRARGAIEFSRTDPRPAPLESILEGIARYQSSVRTRPALAETPRRARRASPTAIAPLRRPELPPAVPDCADPASRRTRGRPRSSPQDWDLLGPRGFAIIGGAVTAFGIILLFVLAANRGWITPAMRVAFGACVSAAAVGVAFWVRSRYGQLQMSLGAAGAGIAGGYATLAAAAARYDLVPDWLALPLAGGLAALAVVIAIAWSSETVAAIGLLGAALAPALQAIDTGLSWPSVAFAVIILGRDGGARRASSLARAVDRDRRRRRRAGCSARARRRRVGRRRHDRRRRLIRAGRARGGGLAAARLRDDGSRSARELVRARRRRPRAPARAAALGRRPQPGPRARRRGRGLGRCLDRAPPCCSLPLPSCSVSRRSRSPPSPPPTCCRERASRSPGRPRRCSCPSSPCGCATRACRRPPSSTAPSPRRTCSSSTRRRSWSSRSPLPGSAAASVAALALALLGAGLLAPAEAVARTETGLLAWLAPVRVWLAAHRVGLQEGLVLGAAAAGTYAVAILLIAHSFRPGHLAATIVAAAVGAAAPWRSRRGAAPSSSSRRRSPGSAACSPSPPASMCPSSRSTRSTARTAAGR